MATVPFDIDEHYEPRVGDKVEITYVDDTVAVYIITRLTEFGDYYGHTKQERSWIPRYKSAPWRDNVVSGRVLYRKPVKPRVGDVITGPEVFELPLGSVVYSQTSSYRAVLILSDRRPCLRRVDNHYVWHIILSTNIRYKIEFIPEN